jgi:hypothetical protein
MFSSFLQFAFIKSSQVANIFFGSEEIPCLLWNITTVVNWYDALADNPGDQIHIHGQPINILLTLSLTMEGKSM